MKEIPKINYAGVEWNAMKAFLINELQAYREANDSIQADQQTSYTRGKIAYIKELLDLENRHSRTLSR